MAKINHVKLLLIILLLTLVGCSANTGEFLVKNNSNKKITAQVIVSDSEFRMENIDVGQSIRKTYKIKADSAYKVEINFSDGSKLSKEIGYVTSGFNYKHVLTVTEQDVTITGSFD